MAKKSGKKSKARSSGIQDLVEGGQQLLSATQERAEDAAKRVQKSVQDAVGAAEKRYNVELKNLQGRLRDLNTNLGGLERSYRTMEKRFTKQIETLSGRAVKASDLETRIGTLEGEVRRARGLGGSPATAVPTPAKSTRRRVRKAASRARKATSTARSSTAAKAT